MSESSRTEVEDMTESEIDALLSKLAGDVDDPVLSEAFELASQVDTTESQKEGG